MCMSCTMCSCAFHVMHTQVVEVKKVAVGALVRIQAEARAEVRPVPGSGCVFPVQHAICLACCKHVISHMVCLCGRDGVFQHTLGPELSLPFPACCCC